MKILIVNFSDIKGGAARAANRLYKSLINEGIDAKMLVLAKQSNDKNTIGTKTNLQKRLVQFYGLINSLPLKNYKITSPFSPSFSSSLKIVKKINKLNPDIVHLHWINAGMLRIEDFLKIKAPIVWSLHDMWALTGGCHYSGECVAYKESCGKCPILQSKNENDISNKQFKRKQKVFSRISNITIVGLSKWLEKNAKASMLFKEKDIFNLPNPIDTNVFKPYSKITSRKLLGLPIDKKLVLFCSMSATSHVRKGFTQLADALKEITNENLELLVLGSDKPDKPHEFGFKTHYFGHVNDDTNLVGLYNAADVIVVPSLQENLPNVIMEGLSSGIPVVAFAIGGNSDMIEHKKNGYLAIPYKTDDLARGINWVINHNDYFNLSMYAREKVLNNFDSKIVANKYIVLYSNILKKSKT
ncbi:glycosyltransferase family 4 protein [Yeosuana sp. AK3]